MVDPLPCERSGQNKSAFVEANYLLPGGHSAPFRGFSTGIRKSMSGMLHKLSCQPCIQHAAACKSGSNFMHQIKHGTYRLIVQPEGKRVAADAARTLV